MFGKSKENAWYYKAQKAYKKDKLPTPYSALFDYVSFMDKKRLTGGRGHFDFFSLAKFDNRLDSRVNDLRSILPNGLLENFNKAYDKYITLGDDFEPKTIIGAFKEFDEFAFSNYEQLQTILKEFITEMLNKHYL